MRGWISPACWPRVGHELSIVRILKVFDTEVFQVVFHHDEVRLRNQPPLKPALLRPVRK